MDCQGETGKGRRIGRQAKAKKRDDLKNKKKGMKERVVGGGSGGD
jgi:hypothetical protein